MLKKLEIRNYALITDLRLDLGKGLTILTGETGAGKSIMMGALSLLLGERADTKVISDGSKKSLVEATFVDVPGELREILENNDIDWNGGEVIVRREISVSGRSRAFINDTPVNLTLLADVSRRLVDIHSQHSNAKLSDPASQLEIIDAMASDSQLLEDYRKEFHKFVSLRARIKRLKDEKIKARENMDFLRFQKEQLDKLAPKRGELEEIERRYDILSDADEIKENLSEAVSILRGGDNGILERLAEIRSLTDKIDFSLFDSENANDTVRRLEEAYIELKDIAETLEDYTSDVDADPATLNKISSRMNLYYDTMKRFRVTNGDELVDLHEDINSRLDSISGSGADIAELENEARESGKTLKDKAEKLSDARFKAADAFSNLINRKARPLGLTNMNFAVEISEGKLTADGRDRIEFVCAFNKSQQPQPIAKAASGGEISRLMLTMKGILADKMNLPTVIFDEIDTGVSGEIADKMGGMMKDMSDKMQVLTITHLPQVASKGNDHLKVYKKDTGERTVTHIKRLSQEERIKEIAGMLSGSEVNDAAISNARNLLGLDGTPNSGLFGNI